jgi:hypothetical protein
MRRVGIVALARRLVIALWRYLEHGEIPAGATLKPATAVKPNKRIAMNGLADERNIMIEGRRARNVGGSQRGTVPKDGARR